ncbi:hypothetical protein HDU76_000805 [Blyttiomyces sp. JEL0837]|nr:hypothetical protein HDU76_000805 [Blyttiomyces sp. JEL0837]
MFARVNVDFSSEVRFQTELTDSMNVYRLNMSVEGRRRIYAQRIDTDNVNEQIVFEMLKKWNAPQSERPDMSNPDEIVAWTTGRTRSLCIGIINEFQKAPALYGLNAEDFIAVITKPLTQSALKLVKTLADCNHSSFVVENWNRLVSFCCHLSETNQGVSSTLLISVMYDDKVFLDDFLESLSCRSSMPSRISRLVHTVTRNLPRLSLSSTREVLNLKVQQWLISTCPGSEYPFHLAKAARHIFQSSNIYFDYKAFHTLLSIRRDALKLRQQMDITTLLQPEVPKTCEAWFRDILTKLNAKEPSIEIEIKRNHALRFASLFLSEYEIQQVEMDASRSSCDMVVDSSVQPPLTGTRLSDLEQHLSKSKERIKVLTSQASAQNTTIKNLKLRMKRSDEEIKDLRKLKNDLLLTNHELSKRNHSLQTQIDIYKTQLRNQNDCMQRESEFYRREVQTLSIQLQKSRHELEASQHEVGEMRYQMAIANGGLNPINVGMVKSAYETAIGRIQSFLRASKHASSMIFSEFMLAAVEVGELSIESRLRHVAALTLGSSSLQSMPSEEYRNNRLRTFAVGVMQAHIEKIQVECVEQSMEYVKSCVEDEEFLESFQSESSLSHEHVAIVRLAKAQRAVMFLVEKNDSNSKPIDMLNEILEDIAKKLVEIGVLVAVVTPRISVEQTERTSEVDCVYRFDELNISNPNLEFVVIIPGLFCTIVGNQKQCVRKAICASALRVITMSGNKEHTCNEFDEMATKMKIDIKPPRFNVRLDEAVKWIVALTRKVVVAILRSDINRNSETEAIHALDPNILVETIFGIGDWDEFPSANVSVLKQLELSRIRNAHLLVKLLTSDVRKKMVGWQEVKDCLINELKRFWTYYLGDDTEASLAIVLVMYDYKPFLKAFTELYEEKLLASRYDAGISLLSTVLDCMEYMTWSRPRKSQKHLPSNIQADQQWLVASCQLRDRTYYIATAAFKFFGDETKGQWFQKYKTFNNILTIDQHAKAFKKSYGQHLSRHGEESCLVWLEKAISNIRSSSWLQKQQMIVAVLEFAALLLSNTELIAFVSRRGLESDFDIDDFLLTHLNYDSYLAEIWKRKISVVKRECDAQVAADKQRIEYLEASLLQRNNLIKDRDETNTALKNRLRQETEQIQCMKSLIESLKRSSERLQQQLTSSNNRLTQQQAEQTRQVEFFTKETDELNKRVHAFEKALNESRREVGDLRSQMAIANGNLNPLTVAMIQNAYESVACKTQSFLRASKYAPAENFSRFVISAVATGESYVAIRLQTAIVAAMGASTICKSETDIAAKDRLQRFITGVMQASISTIQDECIKMAVNVISFISYNPHLEEEVQARAYQQGFFDPNIISNLAVSRIAILRKLPVDESKSFDSWNERLYPILTKLIEIGVMIAVVTPKVTVRDYKPQNQVDQVDSIYKLDQLKFNPPQTPFAIIPGLFSSVEGGGEQCLRKVICAG